MIPKCKYISVKSMHMQRILRMGTLFSLGQLYLPALLWTELIQQPDSRGKKNQFYSLIQYQAWRVFVHFVLCASRKGTHSLAETVEMDAYTHIPANGDTHRSFTGLSIQVYGRKMEIRCCMNVGELRAPLCVCCVLPLSVQCERQTQSI